VGIEIGGNKVGGGKLGACAEKLGTSLEVRDTAEEIKSNALECGKVGSSSKEGGDEIVAADGLAKVASPGGGLGVGGEKV
jgi:hypothetical protein